LEHVHIQIAELIGVSTLKLVVESMGYMVAKRVSIY